MSAPLAPSTPIDNAVPPAVLCLRCGYDLRGMADDGTCPECGLGVGRSVQGQRELHRGRPGWVGRLRIGAWLLLLVQIEVLALVLALAFDVQATGSPETIFAVSLVVPGQLLLTHAVALVLLTGRENRFERRLPGNRGRVLVRLSVANDVWIGLCIAKLATSTGWTPQQLWEYGLAAGMGAFAVVWALTFAHLRRLARRVLDRSLAEHCLIVGIGLPLAVAGPFALAWLGTGITEGPVGFATVLGVAVALLLFVIWSVYLLAWFAVAFGRAAKTARATWAAADKLG